MILRDYDPAADAARIAAFACSTGTTFEDEVGQWIRTDAIAWLDDLPRAAFQRRALGLVEEDDSLIAVVAWQDIVRVDLDGIWLEVLAISVDQQHRGKGAEVYELVIDRLRAIDRDGDYIAGLVHGDNTRSRGLLGSKGWTYVSTSGDHELWVGSL